MVGSTPPFSTHKQLTSISGKRSLKFRYRSNGEKDDSLLLGDFDGIGGGMFLHDQDGAFSCRTSPFQPRFSCDGIESDGGEGGD